MRKAMPLQLGKVIRNIRNEIEMSQYVLGEFLGITANAVSLIENGHRQPSIEVIEKFAEFTHIPISALMALAEKETLIVGPSEHRQLLHLATQIQMQEVIKLCQN
jgi:transcriptional regulator with XRE-family HTH domain